MAKFKYLRGGRVFESDKTYNLPTIGDGGKLIFPKAAEKAAAKFKAGGVSTAPLKTFTSPLDSFKKRKFDLTPEVTPSTSSASSSRAAGTFGKMFASAAPFFDNVANLAATKATPKIPNPILTPPPRLATKLNINPQLRRVENDALSANKAIDMGTSSAGVANANKGEVMANKLRAVGDLEANKQNFEAYQGNQAAMADYQGRLQNNSLVNQKNFNQMMRTDDVNQRYASVVSDFGSDIANINREKNAMALDRDALKMLMKVNPDAVYQFGDTQTFKDLYKNDEPGLRKLILTQKGSAKQASLMQLYKSLYNKEFTQ